MWLRMSQAISLSCNVSSMSNVVAAPPGIVVPGLLALPLVRSGDDGKCLMSSSCVKRSWRCWRVRRRVVSVSIGGVFLVEWVVEAPYIGFVVGGVFAACA